MIRYTVAQTRARLAAVLDAAERGEAVVVERRGVRFRVLPETPEPTRHRPPRPIAYVDPRLLDGEWTWTWRPRGLQLRVRRSRR